MATKDYYKILQIDPSAEIEVIEGAYRRLARKYHPDVNKSADAHERMKDLNEAFEVLSDPMRRAAYDRQRNATPPPPPPRPAEIVLSTTQLSFGTLTKGTKRSMSVTISNQGGPVQTPVNIRWETVPFWAEPLRVEETNGTFPITATVTLRSIIDTGVYSGRIIIDVDGKRYTVSVSAAIVEPAQAHTPPAPDYTRPTQPTPPPMDIKIPWKIIVGALAIIACISFFAISNATNQYNERIAADEAEQKSAQATATALAEDPFLDPNYYSAHVRELSNQVSLENVSFSIHPVDPLFSLNPPTWAGSFDIQNNSDWPIVILDVYWENAPEGLGHKKDYPIKFSIEYGQCRGPDSNPSWLQGPILEKEDWATFGVGVRSTENFECEVNIDSDADLQILEGPMCAVLYPWTKGSQGLYSNNEIDNPITLCSR